MIDTKEDAYAGRYEKVISALQALFPEEKDFDSRIKLITTIQGKAPNIYKLYLAHCHWEVLSAMEEDRDINWEKLDPVIFLTSYAPSIKGRHADRAVEIARESQIVAERGFIDKLLGRE